MGRSPSGRFGPGNRYARGNPHARKVARLRSSLLSAVTPKDLKDVVAVLLSQAKAGDVPAIKELLQRLLGPPVELDFVEKMELLEQKVMDLQRRGQQW